MSPFDGYREIIGEAGRVELALQLSNLYEARRGRRCFVVGVPQFQAVPDVVYFEGGTWGEPTQVHVRATRNDGVSWWRYKRMS